MSGARRPGGTINVSRDLWNDTTFRDGIFTQREAWLWLLAEATFSIRERNIHGIEITTYRGQLAHSVRFMGSAWQWNEAKVRRYLKVLKNRRMIETKTDAGITVITISNYDKYQWSGEKTDAPPTQQPTQHRRTTDANDNTEDIQLKIESTREAFDAYNELAKRVGLSVAQVLTDKRKKSLTGRLKDAGGIEGWKAALAKLEASSFLTGEKTDWKANLDFMLQSSSFVKLMEGAYDDTGPKPPTTSPNGRARRGNNADRLAASLGRAPSRSRDP